MSGTYSRITCFFHHLRSFVKCCHYTTKLLLPSLSLSLSSHPDLPLPAPISPLPDPAAAGAQAAVLGGGQVLVHGPAVRDEAQAQLEVPGQAAVGGQRQNQQGGDQEEAHHQQSHTAAVVEQVGAERAGPVGANRRMAEETERHHDDGRRQDGPEHQSGQEGVDGGDHEVLSRHEHGAGPAVQGPP